MIPLDSPMWSDLTDAYGASEDIPTLLRELESFPVCNSYTDEPWFSLWSALCHQGDAYSASMAAVPHLFRIAASAPERADSNFFHLPVVIEIARSTERGPEMVPDNVVQAYLAAWSAFPTLFKACMDRTWDQDFCQIAAAALCIAKGQVDLAAAMLELTPDIIPEFMTWLGER